MRRAVLATAATAAIALCCALALVPSASALPLDPKLFPAPAALEPAIRFWQDIFAEYESTQVVIHDDRYLQVVYGVVDVADLDLSGMSDVRKARERQRRVKAAMEEVRLALRVLAGERRASVDQRVLDEVRQQWQAVPDGERQYRAAQGRVRSQAGLRDRFAEAIKISGMFMPGIRAILRENGVPEAVACMPFVESMFNYKARSKVGASGAWQFTRSTGQMFLQIDSAVDARSDVLLAADGAARMLRRGYERIGSWPLTLTGYNHGMAGMARAARQFGNDDIVGVVERYKSRTFGFASRNFYVEFLAAYRTYVDRERLFPGVRPLPELRFEELRADRYFSLLDIAQLAQTAEDQLVALNPALNREVARGEMLVPPGYPFRVPEGSLAQFERAYEQIPAERRRTRQLATQHRVRSGETVGVIARRYGTSVAAIQRANNLPRADRIYVGQVLEVPSRGGAGGSGWQARVDLSAVAVAAATDAPANTALAAQQEEAPTAATGESAPDLDGASTQVHIVRTGESLSAIAERYQVDAALLARTNRLSSPDRIAVGQRLLVPATGSRLHTVRPGDTLGGIAELYGTSVGALQRANQLQGTVIRVGQELEVPPARGG